MQPLRSLLSKRLGLLVVAIVLASVSLSHAQKQVYEFRDGQWVTRKTPTSRPSSDPTLDRVDQLIQSSQFSPARETLLYWIRANPVHPLRDRAVFQLARIYFELDDRILSFYHCDEVMDTWPESPFFYPALELQYRIADDYVSGHKDKFMGVRVMDRSDAGIEMLFRIQERSPGSPLAEKALLRTADFYFADSQFDLAYDAYNAYVRSYGRSPYAPRARLRAAISSLAQFRATKFDATPLLDARAQFSDIARDYPQLATEENLNEWIVKIDQTLARKLLDTSSYYSRVHQPVASRYTLQQATNRFPATPEADVARRLLKEWESK